jgi:hypothetical protein
MFEVPGVGLRVQGSGVKVPGPRAQGFSFIFLKGSLRTVTLKRWEVMECHDPLNL